MPKEIKGNSGRKPPEASASHSDIDRWLGRQMPHLQPIVHGLDEAIRATIPALHYAVKWKRPYYGLPNLGWIIQLAAYDVSVNVVFLGGADFGTPPPLGTTDRTRYVKVTSLADAQRPELHEWIEEQAALRGGLESCPRSICSLPNAEASRFGGALARGRPAAPAPVG
jgi:hypothetical protein